MWLLEFSSSGKRSTIWLPPSRPYYTVGRKNANIVLHDRLVSTKHAQLKLVRGNNRGSQLVVVDTDSSQGTIIRSRSDGGPPTAAIRFTEYSLNDGDQVEFAAEGFTVRWRPIVICTSSIADEQQLILESAKSCDYSVRAQWTADCTHLVTSQVKSSIKTIVALQSGAHIVSVEWLKQYIDHAKRIRTLTDTEPLPDFFEPDPAKFLPPVAINPFGLEKLSWQPDDRRRYLFRDCHFYLFGGKERFAQLSDVIQRSSGQCDFIGTAKDLAMTLKTCNYAFECLSQMPDAHLIDESPVYEAVVKLELPQNLTTTSVDSALAEPSRPRMKFVQMPSVVTINNVDESLRPVNPIIHDVVDDEKDENIDVNPFALKPRHAQQLSKPVVPTVVQSRQAKQKQDEEENDDSANDNPFAVKRKRKPLLSAFASRDDFTADDKETASPAKRHKTTLTAKHSPLASLNRPSPFLTPPAPTQVNMQQQQEQLKQLSTAAHEPGPRTVYKCPEDKPEISSKTIVITADNLIVNQPTRGIRNTKRFVKCLPTASGKYQRIIGVADMTPDVYRPSRGALEPWLFEGKGTTKKQAM